ncbi:hypothetical protein MGYG_07626 [Nannizzia gypsea CBS 118893]|uniref:Uncharacterized protein n=1 Tax=Arthroderma gypseum (strain ATCC MYA-4604 / CBS 118893) TaxID=535722 RepID=E4V3P5_ARTGP|nr:hypothetical protein MGYG_07626 [Nannizzia gypsea CBS 118893]EFR04619.1 hypothetical protein MGYG_07626 [Nannizzia gypsea CBS 118893]
MESLKSGLQAAEDALLGHHKSGHEPASGVQGKGTATDPYDAGNATHQPTETHGMTGKHGTGQHGHGNKIDEGIGGLDDTARRTAGKPTTGGYTSQETGHIPGKTTQGTGRVDEGISGVGRDKAGYGEKALRSEMQQGDQYSSTMASGQKPSTGAKMSGGLTDDTLAGTGGATAIGAAGGAAGAGAMGRGQEPGMSGMKQQSGMTDSTGRTPGTTTYGSDMPSGTSGGYGQTKHSQLGTEHGREMGGGAALGSGDVTGTGHGSQHQHHLGGTTGRETVGGGILGSGDATGTGHGSQSQHHSGGTTLGREAVGGATLGSGDVTGTGHGSQYQHHPGSTTHGQHGTTGGLVGGSTHDGSSKYTPEMKQGQTAGNMPGGGSSGTSGFGSSDIKQGAPTTGHGGSQTGMSQGISTTGHTGSGYGSSQHSELNQGIPSSQTTGGNMGRTTDMGHGASDPSSAMRHDAPIASTSSRTTSSVPAHAPSGTGQNPVKSTGFAAEGGNFDATQPGAGREADRLLDQRTSKAGQSSSTTGHGNTGTTTHDPLTGSHETHTSHKTSSITQKAKDALHIGKHSKP